MLKRRNFLKLGLAPAALSIPFTTQASATTKKEPPSENQHRPKTNTPECQSHGILAPCNAQAVAHLIDKTFRNKIISISRTILDESEGKLYDTTISVDQQFVADWEDGHEYKLLARAHKRTPSTNTTCLSFSAGHAYYTFYSTAKHSQSDAESAHLGGHNTHFQFKIDELTLTARPYNFLCVYHFKIQRKCSKANYHKRVPTLYGYNMHRGTPRT